MTFDFYMKLDNGETGKYPPPFDINFPYREKLPRKAIFSLKDNQNNTVITHFIHADGGKEQLGDPLKDTNYDQDGWGKYHDGGHICMCLLGWCLHLRIFLKIKRKSDDATDRVEDGPEANIADEGIQFALINRIKRDKLVLNSPKDVPQDLVEYAKLQFFGKELERTTNNEWKQVFYTMYQVMKRLRENEGGYIYVNLLKREVAYDKALKMEFYD